MKKSLILLGHFSLLVTAILAIVFYKERVLYVDPGQQLFEMINGDYFKVFVQRYSMVINQSIPLLAIKLGLPLKFVVMSYSLSFVFIYYLCFIISVYGFKNISAGLGIAFVPLFIQTAFGHSISEAWLGVAYSAVFYALLNYYDQWKKKGAFFIFLFYLLIIIIVGINYFIHPITLFTIGFGIGYTYFNKQAFKKPYIYIVGIFVIAVYMWKFFFPSHTHEESFFSGIKNADVFLPQITKLPIWGFFFAYFFKIYFFGTLFLFATGILSIFKKKLLSFFFVLGFAAAYFVVACLAFHKGDAMFAYESRLIPLIFIFTIPFIELIKDFKKNYLIVAGLSVILIYCFIQLSRMVVHIQSARIHFYENALEKTKIYPERKFYVFLPDDQYTPINSWGSAVETLMLSSLDGKENSRSIIFVRKGTDVTIGLNYWPCTFLWVPWYLFYPEENLKAKYFDLQCTKYRELSYTDLQ